MFEKPKRRKTCLDMSGAAFPKINRKQREHKAARKETGRKRCEYDGCALPAGLGPHHILQKSVLLIDHIFNLIDLCWIHHPQADEFELPSRRLFEIVARREKVTVQYILDTLSEIAGAKVYLDDRGRVKVQKLIMQRAVKHGTNREIS